MLSARTAHRHSHCRYRVTLSRSYTLATSRQPLRERFPFVLTQLPILPCSGTTLRASNHVQRGSLSSRLHCTPQHTRLQRSVLETHYPPLASQSFRSDRFQACICYRPPGLESLIRRAIFLSELRPSVQVYILGLITSVTLTKGLLSRIIIHRISTPTYRLRNPPGFHPKVIPHSLSTTHCCYRH